MVTELQEELIRIGKAIEEGNCSYGELAFLQDHKQEVLEMGDIRLCEQAGITEEEYNKGELNPELSYKENFIRLEIDNDGEGNPSCTIKLDDGDELTLTQFELLNLKKILDNNITEINEYFERISAQCN